MSTVTMPKELTAENGAKKLLTGEFKETVVMQCDACIDGVRGDWVCEACEGAGNYNVHVTVSWTTIKAIYAMAVKELGE